MIRHRLKLINIDNNEHVKLMRVLTDADINVLSTNHILINDDKRYLITAIEHEITEDAHTVTIKLTENINENLICLLHTPKKFINSVLPKNVYSMCAELEQKIGIIVVPFVTYENEFKADIINPKMINICVDELREQVLNKINEITKVV